MGFNIRRRHNKDGSVTTTTSISHKGLFGIRYTDTYTTKTDGKIHQPVKTSSDNSKDDKSGNPQNKISTSKNNTVSKQIKLESNHTYDDMLLVEKAIDIVIEMGQASISSLQRKLKLDYARAARIVDELENMGVVGPYEGAKPRKVLITKQQWTEKRMNNEFETSQTKSNPNTLINKNLLLLPRQHDGIEYAIIFAYIMNSRNMKVTSDSLQAVANIKSETAKYAINQLERLGIIGPDEGEKSRKVYITKEEFFHRVQQFDLTNFVNEFNNTLESRLRQITTNVDQTKSVAPKENINELMEQLDNLIGLDNVKKDVKSLINLINVQNERQKKSLPEVPISKHLVFLGNPGTGKTTVARLLAQIYKSLGIIPKGQLIEVDRSKLVGGYVGQTAIKTQNVINEAMGGVLFIDEAYTLIGKSENDFGQESVDTLLKAMEDSRDKFVVITAGYTNLMNDFLESNPGLKSRFNKFIVFDDYTPDELTDIFIKMCHDAGYLLYAQTVECVRKYMKKMYKEKTENFANAREVRNFFEKAIVNQANRISKNNDFSDNALTVLLPEDLGIDVQSN